MFVSIQIYFEIAILVKKLDGVGPVDNRPSNNKLHPIFRKKEEEKNTQDM